MLAYAAMMTGQRALAMKHIRAMVAEMPSDFLKENAMQAEGFVAMPLEVMVRFGMWDEILAEPDNYPEYMTGHARFSSCRASHRLCRERRHRKCAQGTGDFPRKIEARAERGNLW